ncbi:hypothetical protein VTK73DRAFT_10318 [Phialemonium thermophilum]|uniref:Uncharacterized protein n=1 Tax=Phialemonium thermophilum TaxID=223376 RepID=A0ABR3XH19_9PEZI
MIDLGQDFLVNPSQLAELIIPELSGLTQAKSVFAAWEEALRGLLTGTGVSLEVIAREAVESYQIQTAIKMSTSQLSRNYKLILLVPPIQLFLVNLSVQYRYPVPSQRHLFCYQENLHLSVKMGRSKKGSARRPVVKSAGSPASSKASPQVTPQKRKVADTDSESGASSFGGLHNRVVTGSSGRTRI